MPRYLASDELPGFARWLDAGRLAYPENLAEPYFVVEDTGQVVAGGGFCVQPDQHLLTMAWGMVRYDLHRQGIGRKLLHRRLQFADAQLPNCTVALDTSQHTYSFFEKQGFRITKIMPDGYGPRLDRYDMERSASM
jgi:ribosomal-protein-alanine N-acetyltransferase